ncbi:unnamed protein product, partial [Brassica rapa subsp. trilocularis]
TTPIYFAVNQRDPMVAQTVKPFKPFGSFVTEVLEMSGRELMQPDSVEVQNRRNHSNLAIAHVTGIKVVIDKVDEMDKRLRELEAFVKEKSASTRDEEPPLVNHVLEVPCANEEFGCPGKVANFAMQRHLLQCEYSSTLEGRCVCPFSGCRYIGTYRRLYAHTSSVHSDGLQWIECEETRCISPNVSGMENFSWKLTVHSGASFLSYEQTIIDRANGASSELPPKSFVVPSFMCPATEVLILINRVETVG